MTDRGNQLECSSLNHKQSSNQSNHRGGGAGRGIEDGRKPDKIHIQFYKCQKYEHYASQCRRDKKKIKKMMQDLKNTKNKRCC